MHMFMLFMILLAITGGGAAVAHFFKLLGIIGLCIVAAVGLLAIGSLLKTHPTPHIASASAPYVMHPRKAGYDEWLDTYVPCLNIVEAKQKTDPNFKLFDKECRALFPPSPL